MIWLKWLKGGVLINKVSRKKPTKLYAIQHLREPYKLLAFMIYILYGEDICFVFRMEWAPMVNDVTTHC